MNFTDLDFQSHPFGNGIQALKFFDNNYGVSVVRFTTPFGAGSYGSEEGLYEVAILKGVEDEWEICYDTPITEDVLGHLTEEHVTNLLSQVQSL